ncbi:MAG: TSUP family transporter [Lachnospiraceae bacterium]|nr:TSUP family transporter [Lachnospiraceae bacterium]
MQINLWTYLIACPLVFLAGFVDAIAGGGGLISLPGYLIAGLPPIMASATNKMSAGMGATVAFGNYLKNGFVELKLAAPCILISMIFSSIGARVQMMIPEHYLKVFMLIALPVTLLLVLNKETLKSKSIFKTKLTRRVFVEAGLISAAIGFYDGVYGPATGTFLLIFFVKIVGMNIKESNGIAKAINWATNMGALVLFISSGRVLISLGIVCGLFNMMGNYLGSNLFMKKGVDIARPIMITVMVIFIIRITLELLHII